MQKKKSLVYLYYLLLILLTAGCQKPLTPQYLGIENLQVSKLAANESLVSANLKFYNPNPYPLQLKHADMNIYIDEKQAGHSILDSTIYIRKQDSFSVPVTVNIDLGNILSNALQLLLKGQVKISAEGTIKVKKSGIGFNIPVHYEGYQNLDSLLRQIN